MRLPDQTDALTALVVAIRTYRENRRRRIEAALLFDIPFLLTVVAIALLVRRLRGRPALVDPARVRAMLRRWTAARG